ncbi:hypothetical protein SmJEL517_g01119 [Synchytrium microbalum]|uniref:Large ribosomal subunit protein mL46 n=1 Tax=Synchytrium microbalum TaxID=1806994 RepID=A0A507CBR2_9FUNG|nr:uncharacterized protein SmJEL517_g01119 [Synchytrium microbalum]TPX37062.1 hypothetical protein SmJEL517_g01119 [Synchytrium microbalum]
MMRGCSRLIQQIRTHATVAHSIRVGILLKRDPVITPNPDEFSSSYLNYRHSLENAHSRPFPYEFYFKRGSLQEQRWLDATKGQPNDDGIKLVKEHELASIPVAPRRTIADEANDTASLDRALDRTLYLVLKGEHGWRLPEGNLNGDELLHQAASRELHTQCGNGMETWFVGSIPVGHVTRGPNETVFYMKAHILGGTIASTSDNTVAWLTKEEALKALSQDDAIQVADMLSTR